MTLLFCRVKFFLIYRYCSNRNAYRRRFAFPNPISNHPAHRTRRSCQICHKQSVSSQTVCRESTSGVETKPTEPQYCCSPQYSGRSVSRICLNRKKCKLGSAMIVQLIPTVLMKTMIESYPEMCWYYFSGYHLFVTFSTSDEKAFSLGDQDYGRSWECVVIACHGESVGADVKYCQ